MENIFTQNDYKQIEKHGISIEKIEKQIYFYQNGIPKIKLEKPATLSGGIIKISDKEKDEIISLLTKIFQNTILKNLFQLRVQQVECLNF